MRSVMGRWEIHARRAIVGHRRATAKIERVSQHCRTVPEPPRQGRCRHRRKKACTTIEAVYRAAFAQFLPLAAGRRTTPSASPTALQTPMLGLTHRLVRLLLIALAGFAFNAR